jgi:hypothetical protein
MTPARAPEGKRQPAKKTTSKSKVKQGRDAVSPPHPDELEVEARGGRREPEPREK